MARVKVCGLTNETDLGVAVEAGADAVGAIVDVPVDTPREVDPSRAATLFDSAPPFVSTVLVTMPESIDRATELVERTRPDVLQVHAGLPPESIDELVESGITTVAAVDHGDDVEAFAEAADALIVDSTDESGAGGTGRTHDWAATSNLGPLAAPVVLAGGLTPENVTEAIEAVDPFAVDVSSGVEIEPGQKDPGLVAAFVAEATGSEVRR
mgnify:CR=1 FL=1